MRPILTLDDGEQIFSTKWEIRNSQLMRRGEVLRMGFTIISCQQRRESGVPGAAESGCDNCTEPNLNLVEKLLFVRCLCTQQGHPPIFKPLSSSPIARGSLPPPVTAHFCPKVHYQLLKLEGKY